MTKLSKSIDVRASNRPAKIAFIVPNDESQLSNWILDGIFYEAYTRWGGAKSLIIPFNEEEPIQEEYIAWLTQYDPDFIYSYVDMPKVQIEQLNKCSLPIKMIRHLVHGEIERWRQFIPKWPYGFTPVTAISTINSPYAKYQGWSDTEQSKVYITQNYSIDEHRFFPDNFGVSYNVDGPSYGRVNSFATKSYCSTEVPENNVVGNMRSDKIIDFVSELSAKKLKTFLQLSSIHAAGVNHPVVHSWQTAFHIFIGNSFSDRLNFWNSRLISSNDYRHNFHALCISTELALDSNFALSVGNFLNAFNFCGHNNGAHSVHIRSFSNSKEVCEQVKELIKPHTWGYVSVPETFNELAVPNPQSLAHCYSNHQSPSQSFKMYERSLKLVIDEPEHFKYLAPDLYDFKSGQSIVNLHIEKPKENCQVVGGFNDWKLPKRIEVTYPFTKNNSSKVSINGTLTVIPHVPDRMFNMDNPDKLTISLSIPDEENIFRTLILPDILSDDTDMRHCLISDNKYKDIELSDKGQKHRGVISLFENDLSLASVLTNAYWRNIIRESKKKPNKTYSLDKLESIIMGYSQHELEHITRDMRFSNLGITKNYLKKNLRDTVEYFIHQKIMIQQYKWRCSYCGNDNSFTLDTIKIENNCTVCQNIHKTPIDMEWEYKISPFIISALADQNGLTVLWAINHLLDSYRGAQSIYLPEVDLYKEHQGYEKNEIDFLAIIDGKFIAAEVKLSAASFVDNNSEVDSFIDEITKLTPDIAYLIFEQYCDNANEIETFHQKLLNIEANITQKISSSTRLRVIIANKVISFSEIPIELGPYGKRTHKFLDGLPN